MKDGAALHGTRVFLTGFMASGKSTLGPVLADRLGLRFRDLDDVVAEQAGQSIETIFASHGEASFRTMERAALLSTLTGCVYALGGGAVTRKDNMDWALANGIVLYLQVTPSEIMQRLESDGTPRPLLQGTDGVQLTGEALDERIARLLEERAPYYERAHYTVQYKGSQAGLVDKAAKAVCDYLGASRKERR